MKRVLKVAVSILIALFILLNIVTAFHAYKFTHFYEPGEIAVTDSHHKNAWPKVKELFFGLNFVKKKSAEIPDESYETVILTTKDNLKLEGWYIPVSHPKGTVALFHGHGGNKADVLPESREFMKLGYNVFLLDFRAHGNSDGNTCTIGYREAEDVKLVYDHIRSSGEKNIILWGISLGAATITKAISEYDCKPEKIILELPFGSIEQAVKARLRMMSLPPQPLASMLTFWGGIENNFWAFDNKPFEYVKKISCPVLLQFAAKDIRVTKEERESICQNVSAPKTVVIYLNSGHESLCKSEHNKWIESVASFLNA